MIADLDDPMTGHTFRASGLMDQVMFRGQRMSVAPSDTRATLLAECLSRFAELRDLARGPFADRASFLLAAIDEYEAAIRTLAGLGGGLITCDRRTSDGPCPACGSAITRDPERGVALCGECDKPFMAAYRKLDSSAGFGTMFI